MVVVVVVMMVNEVALLQYTPIHPFLLLCVKRLVVHIPSVHHVSLMTSSLLTLLPLPFSPYPSLHTRPSLPSFPQVLFTNNFHRLAFLFKATLWYYPSSFAGFMLDQLLRMPEWVQLLFFELCIIACTSGYLALLFLTYQMSFVYPILLILFPSAAVLFWLYKDIVYDRFVVERNKQRIARNKVQAVQTKAALKLRHLKNLKASIWTNA